MSTDPVILRLGTSRHPSLRALVALSLPIAGVSLIALPQSAVAAPPAPACVIDGADLTCTVTYGFSGAEEAYVVPDGVEELAVTAVGGAGGSYFGLPGGRPAVVTGTVTVTPGATYYVAVAGRGPDGQGGGFNGGGVAARTYGQGGGGGTDLRTVSRTAPETLDSRVVVAGGGGGASLWHGGGDAGLNGANGGTMGSAPATGGTQTSGGAGANYYGAYVGGDGSQGQGGSDVSSSLGGGGGGGGLYGGGSGAYSSSAAGGSSLVPSGGSVEAGQHGLSPTLVLGRTLPITGLAGMGPAEASVAAGQASAPYTVSVTDGIDSMATTPDSLVISPRGPGTGATCTATTCTATKAGTYTVIGTYAGYTEHTTLEVAPAAASTITVGPDGATATAGEPTSYTVSADDAFGNPLPDQTANAALSVAPAGGGASQSCPDATCTVESAGAHLVTASLPTGGTTLYDSTDLTVTPSIVDSLAINPLDASTTAGDPVQYTATGVDAYGNPIPDLAATITRSSAGGDALVCPDGACAPTAAGEHTIIASAPGAGGAAVTAATTLTVAADGVAALRLGPEDATTTAGTPVDYSVGGTDEFGNELPDQTGSASVSYSAFGQDVPCPDAVCSITEVGTYTVTATGATGVVPDATTLVVTAAPVAAISLYPPDSTTTAGKPVRYTVSGSDTFGNHAGDQSGASVVSVAPAGGGTAQHCPEGVCTPTTAGQHDVTASRPAPGGGDPLVATKTLDVSPAALAVLTVSPDITTATTGDAVPFTATGADAFGNALGDQTAASTVTIARTGSDAVPVVCPEGVCAPTTSGTYRVTFQQGPVTGTASLTVVASTAELKLGPIGDVTFGEDVATSATLSAPAPAATPSGTVQFVLDGVETGSAVTVQSDGTVTGPSLSDLDGGLHTLEAHFTSAPDGAFVTATDEISFVVERAPTTTGVSIGQGSVIATVDGGSAGVATGGVVFSIDGTLVGEAPLVDGVATYTGPTGGSDSVAGAVYSGSRDFAGSSGSTARLDPTIVASYSSASDPSNGWYAGPVTVTFTCTAGSAPVDCPAAVVLDTDGAGQTLTRTVTAEDGGMGSTTTAPIDIDQTAPTARVAKVKHGRAYKGSAPTAVCEGSDSLSGVASCIVDTTSAFPGPVTSTVTVTDQAGNVSTATKAYSVLGAWVAGSELRKGAWRVQRGDTARVHIISEEKPYVKNRAAAGRFRFFGKDDGRKRWVGALRVRGSARPGDVVKVKIRTDDGHRVVKLRITR